MIPGGFQEKCFHIYSVQYTQRYYQNSINKSERDPETRQTFCRENIKIFIYPKAKFLNQIIMLQISKLKIALRSVKIQIM